jgi:ABC-type dipeptide/oligopeptide/nickel transport system permease component
MHSTVFSLFDRLCAARRCGGDVLEIGAVPTDDTLLCLPALAGARSRIGVNLDGPHRHGDFEILRADANSLASLPGFGDATFDTVLCNSVLEHDPFFWKTLAEMKRVTRPGGTIGIGVPGYAKLPVERRASRLAAALSWIGVPAGILAAVKRNSILDHGVMGISLTGYSMPIFWWGLLLILFFSVQLDLTPVSGRIAVQYFIEPVTGFLLIDTLLAHDTDAFWSAVSHLILPTIVLGTNPLAVIARMTRSAMLEVLGEDYIRTARAKGLSSLRVVAVHALRNALIPVITVIGLQVGVLFTGAILTETIFSWPGVGKWLIEAISRRDYPVLQGGMLLLGAVVMAVNLLVDVTYGIINPRIRHQK